MQYSFEHLYSQNKKRIFNLVLSYVPNREDAEEITADVFVEVHNKLPAFRGDAAVETWMYRIAVNKSLDFIRYKKRFKRKGFIISLSDSGEGNDFGGLENFDHPGVKAEHKEKAAILYTALNRLNDNQRTAFILCHIEEMPQKEVADIMQLRLKALESLLQRAKKQMKKILEKEYEWRRKP